MKKTDDDSGIKQQIKLLSALLTKLAMHHTTIMRILLLLLLLPLRSFTQEYSRDQISSWQRQARQVNIIRDKWGVPHIYGKTDADAVFGLLYAQCEDDFNRVELNYIEKLGRLAEIKGESAFADDLYLKLLIDEKDAKKDYADSPAWLKKLLQAFADGINFYLYSNPEVKPLLLKRFEPWFPLLWTDGSIGAISTGGIEPKETNSFYTGAIYKSVAGTNFEPVLTGSNGFAFSPSITASKKSILYINPHVTFYFRPEVHMVSDQGLNVYGAVTWGQFFIYQGFNEKCGWMHTSSDVDVADIYEEKISTSGKGWNYMYNGKQRKVAEKNIVLRYKEKDKMIEKNIKALFTHHGPIMASRNSKWLSVKSNNRSLKSLIQSWQRTKATGFADYKRVMELRSNTSNNTVYADAEGNIAYWHGNFIPKRDTAYKWNLPVEGSTKATEWKGLHTVEESVHLYNPPNGWLQNCNSTPFTVAAKNSPKATDYPRYMAPDGENFRGVNAVRILPLENAYTLDKVIAAGYNTYMAAFELLIPRLVKAYEKSGSNYPALQDPVNILGSWDLHAAENSVATTLAVEWGTKLLPKLVPVEGEDGIIDQVEKTKAFVAASKDDELLKPLEKVINELNIKHGSWRIPWGKINRFQRISGDIEQKYSDSAPSLPVAFTSSVWGMLPSYSARYFPGTKKRYGVNGNSFICVVEFGDRIKAKSLLAGGESGDPSSEHFSDQALMYTKGTFKDVLFYKEDVFKNIERQYHPGE